MDHCLNLAELSDTAYFQALYRKAEQQHQPTSASIELTERCNLNCIHCYLGDQQQLRNNRLKELDTQQWYDLLDQIAAVGCLDLLITGGDPLLRKDFAEIYTYAKYRGFLITIFTNGTLLTDQILELFQQLPPFSIEISLYGATEKTYEQVTQQQGSYQRCLAAIERLHKASIHLVLKSVALKTNYAEIGQIKAIADRYDCKFRLDAEIQAGFNGDKTPLSVRLNPKEAALIEFADPKRATDWWDYYERSKDLSLAHPDRLYQCRAGFKGFHINPYGQLQSCLVVRQLSFDLTQGNLKEGLSWIQQALIAKKPPIDYACHQCENRLFCNSCPAFSYLETGNDATNASFQCQLTQERSRIVHQTKSHKHETTNKETALPKAVTEKD